MNWPFKEEPSHYSYDDLVKDGKTSWTGVKNALAQKHLRQVKRSVVAVAKAVTDSYADPKDKSGKLAAVDVAPVKKLPRPVTLGEIKAKAFFKDFPLVRISRLSVMPVTDDEWSQIEKMASR